MSRPHRRFERAVRYTEQRLGGAPAFKWMLRYVFPDHWSFLLGEIALYSFIVLVVTGIFLTLYYIPGDTPGHLPRLLRAAARPGDVRGLPLGARHLLQRARRAADPPGAPLGGRRVHRRDRAAPDADLLHRRLPQAARPQLLHRADDADAGDPGGIRRLLAGRRPAVRDGAGDRLRRRPVDPVHRRPAGQPDLGRPVPGQRQLPRAPGDRPRPSDPRGAGDPDHASTWR